MILTPCYEMHLKLLKTKVVTKRCAWANASVAEAEYHDVEWGVPVHEDRQLFEALTLESAQSGLSWSTILNKREGFRKAFDHFDVQKVSAYTEAKTQALLQDAGIVRHKLKINATINNAQRVLEIQAEYGSFDTYIWSFVDGKPINNKWQQHTDIPATTPISDAISDNLKQKGFKFIGSTTCYAFMQAIGMVNDHVTSCFRKSQCE